jgi:hypothetical protein
MLKGIAILALALFIEAAFLAAITGPAAPARVTRVEVGELALAPEPSPEGVEPGPVAVHMQGRRPAHPVAR